MTAYSADLNTDLTNIKTSQRYGVVGDGSNQWYGHEKILDGDNVAQGAKADAAVTDPTASGSIIALLKGLLTNLRVAATGLMKLEDAAHASGDAGVMTLAVRKDSLGTLASADGDYTPLAVNASGQLRVTATDEVVPLNATTTAYAASLVVKASAGTLLGLQGYNSLATPQFIQIHDANAVPADAVIPKIIIYVPGESPFSLDFGRLGRSFGIGIVVCNSSTGPTKTLGAADCWVDAQYI